MTISESNTVEAFIRDRLNRLCGEFIDDITKSISPQKACTMSYIVRGAN